jgi:hypothetical protein
MPGMEKPFLIFCHASGQALGCVLMQDGPMVAYPSHDLDLATVVHTLKVWGYYIMERDVNYTQTIRI